MKIQGLPVVDAKKKLTIFITAKDIANAKKKNAAACAAANACLRVPGCTQARVHLGRTYVLVGKKWERRETSRPLRTEIISFDRGAGFQPGEFTLHTLPASKQTTGRQRGGDNKKRGNKTGRNKPHMIVGVRANAAQGSKRG